MKDVEKDGLRVNKEWMKDEIYSKGWISDLLRMKDEICLGGWIKNERQKKNLKGRI